MQEFKRATFHKEYIDEENNSASFVFEPLERGFGTTIGNAVCRVLMTNLPGSGVIGYKISGTPADAMTSPGILEDITGITLNVKALQFTSELDKPETVHISKIGPAIITAADIVCPEEIDMVDPNQIVCTLEKDAILDMELYVAMGVWWMPWQAVPMTSVLKARRRTGRNSSFRKMSSRSILCSHRFARLTICRNRLWWDKI